VLRKCGHEVSFFDAMLAEELLALRTPAQVLKPQLVLSTRTTTIFSARCAWPHRAAPVRHAQAGARAVARDSSRRGRMRPTRPTNISPPAPTRYCTAKRWPRSMALVDRPEWPVGIEATALTAGLRT